MMTGKKLLAFNKFLVNKSLSLCIYYTNGIFHNLKNALHDCYCYPKFLINMKTKHTLLGLAIVAMGLAVALIGCSKSTSADVPAGTQSVNFYLTDGPGLYDKVFVDIKSVKILVDTSSDTRKHDHYDWDANGRGGALDSSLVWQDGNVAAGVYNLLALSNGVDTLLSSANIKAGSIRLIKIELGTNNSLVKDSVTYPLNLPPNANNYILVKLQGNELEHFANSSYRLWLDFDVARSIVNVNNTFYLKPVIHFFVEAQTNSISGTVLPKDAKAIISVYNSTDTAYAIPNGDGKFKVRGIPDGKYSVFINGSNGYVDTTINNVSVSGYSNTSIGTITLHK